MLRVNVPELSSTPLQLSKPFQLVQDFEKKTPKPDKNGIQWVKGNIAIFGEYGLSEIGIKVPQFDGFDQIAPGQFVTLNNVTALLYATEKSKTLNGASLSADSVQDTKGTKGS